MNAERKLLQAIRRGDLEGLKKHFQEFYQENIRIVYRALIDRYGKDFGTDDDVQEAFVRLIEDPQRLLKVDRLRDYVVAIALNIAAKRRGEETRIDALDEGEDVDPRAIELASLVSSDDLFERVYQILGRPDADIVVLHAGFSYTEKEIALSLNMGEDAVHYRYKKSIQKLRREWKDELPNH